jgi:hypothetical protein
VAKPVYQQAQNTGRGLQEGSQVVHMNERDRKSVSTHTNLDLDVNHHVDAHIPDASGSPDACVRTPTRGRESDNTST